MAETVNLGTDTVTGRLLGRHVLHVECHGGDAARNRVHILDDATGACRGNPQEVMVIQADAPFLEFPTGNVILDDFALVLPAFVTRCENDMFLALVANFVKPGTIAAIANEDGVEPERDMVVNPFLEVESVIGLYLHEAVYGKSLILHIQFLFGN